MIFFKTNYRNNDLSSLEKYTYLISLKIIKEYRKIDRNFNPNQIPYFYTESEIFFK